MSSLKMKGDDFKIGQYVTIHSLVDSEIVCPCCNSKFFHSLYHPMGGTPYKVMAISFPFVALKNLLPIAKGNVSSADLRQLNFIQITKKYVNAMIAISHQETTPFHQQSGFPPGLNFLLSPMSPDPNPTPTKH